MVPSSSGGPSRPMNESMTSVADIPGDDADDDLPGISPELVLVDPELARLVRERGPDRASPAGDALTPTSPLRLVATSDDDAPIVPRPAAPAGVERPSETPDVPVPSAPVGPGAREHDEPPRPPAVPPTALAAPALEIEPAAVEPPAVEVEQPVPTAPEPPVVEVEHTAHAVPEPRLSRWSTPRTLCREPSVVEVERSAPHRARAARRRGRAGARVDAPAPADPGAPRGAATPRDGDRWIERAVDGRGNLRAGSRARDAPPGDATDGGGCPARRAPRPRRRGRRMAALLLAVAVASVAVLGVLRLTGGRPTPVAPAAGRQSGFRPARARSSKPKPKPRRAPRRPRRAQRHPRRPSRSPLRSRRRRPSEQRHRSQSPAQLPRRRSRPRLRSRSRSRSQRPRPSPPPRRRRRFRVDRQRRRPHRPRRSPRRATRRFAWAPVDGATGYHVELFRGTDRVLAVDTKEPVLELGSTWRYGGKTVQLTPGAYRWYVWPVTKSGRATQAVVQAKLAVP